MSSESFTPIRIQVHKNGDEHYEGKRVNVTHKLFRNWDQFLTNVSQNVGLKTGAARVIYTINGSEVKTLRELQDQQIYVASSGEPFIQCNYTLEKKKLSNSATEEIRREEQKLEKKAFSPDSKGIRVYVYIEGNHLDVPRRLVLNYRNCKTFAQMLSYLSTELKANDGTIKSVFDAKQFQQMTTMEDFYDGINIIAIANSKLARPRDSFEYPIVTNDKATSPMTEKSIMVKQLQGQELKMQRNQIKKENIFEYGGKGIKVFAHHSGFHKQIPKPIILNWRNCKNWDQFLNLLSFALKPSEGPIRLVFELDLITEINDLTALTDGANVICVSKLSEKAPHPGQYEVQSVQTRPVTANGSKQKTITVFPNGEQFHTGIKVIVSEFKFKTIEKLKEQLDQQLKLHLGKISIIYEFDPQFASNEQLSKNTTLKASNVRKISTIQDILSSNSDYFVVGTNAEPFRNIQYNTNGIQKPSRSSIV